MNKVYRIVWNAASRAWVVASEFAKGRKKAGKRNRTMAWRGGVFALSMLGATAAHAAVITTPAQAQNGTYSGTSTSATATGGDSTAVGAASQATVRARPRLAPLPRPPPRTRRRSAFWRMRQPKNR
jgi:hypothetical protein